MRAGKPNFFPHSRAALAAGAALLFMIAGLNLVAQGTPSNAAPAVAPAQTAPPTDAPAPPKKHKWIQKDEPDGSSASAKPPAPKPAKTTAATDKKPKEKVAKDDRAVQTKDTKAELRRESKYNPLIGKDANLPDKQLYDKAA